MKNFKKSHLILIAVSVPVLLGCIGITAYLLLSNYQNIRLFKQAQSNFQRGDASSLKIAEAQLLQVIAKDSDNENAYIMLGAISGKNRYYPEQVYYCYMAHRLNPLSEKNKSAYIESLCFARYFDRLENFLSQQSDLSPREEDLLLYAACRNSNMSKYKRLYEKRQAGFSIAGLGMFLYDKSSVRIKLEKLKKFPVDDPFLKQEILAAFVELYLDLNDPVNAGKALAQAHMLNPFAFAPALGRFYANFDSFGKALPVFEKHLEVYHDPEIAIQTAEIYCLLKQTGKIAKLREQYQTDTGNSGMLCCYYFDALTALAKNDMASLKELTVPLRKNINTPLADFIFLCADLQSDDPAAVTSSYKALIGRRSYLDLQSRADDMISNYLKHSLKNQSRKPETLLALAETLYQRKPEPFTAKFILLQQMRRYTVNVSLLKDALKRFSSDRGVIWIAIEYYLYRDTAECERLIEFHRNNFATTRMTTLPFEIALAMRKKDFERVSQLFRENFALDIHGQYWEFASTAMREKDLKFLSKDPIYAPFCQALLLMKNGKKDAACDILEKADAKNNLPLLFFAAKTLGENGRNRAALNKYALFPENSSFRLAVLLNTAELYAENGNPAHALGLARKAYNMAPELPETQLCYADKLRKNGNLSEIPDVIKLTRATIYRKELEQLYISGMEARIKMTDAGKSPEKLRQLCETLLRIDSSNGTAAAALSKIRKTVYDKMNPEQQNLNRRE